MIKKCTIFLILMLVTCVKLRIYDIESYDMKQQRLYFTCWIKEWAWIVRIITKKEISILGFN